MTISTGSSLQNRSSTATRSWTRSIQGGLGICVLAGVLAALVDLELRLPLHMPGWRGLLTMALFVGARRLSDRPWGASAAALVAALASIALAGAPRFGTLSFLAPGVVIDAVCLTVASGRTDRLAAALGGAVGNAVKLAISLVGVGVDDPAEHGRLRFLHSLVEPFGVRPRRRSACRAVHAGAHHACRTSEDR